MHPVATSNLGSCSQPLLHVILGTDNTNEHNQIQMIIIPIWLAPVLGCFIQTIWFKEMWLHRHYRFRWIPLTEVYICDLMLAYWMVLQLLNFLMKQNSSVSIVNRKLMLQFKDNSLPFCHVTRITVDSADHTISFTQYYLPKMFRPYGSSPLGYPSSKNIQLYDRPLHTKSRMKKCLIFNF